MANYVQPDYRNPVTPGVEVRPHQPSSPTGNPLALSAPVAVYTQAGTRAPAAPVAGQLDGTVLGRSRHTFADGHSSST